ncbi:MAG: MFS transporter [Hyphomonadaceae bacterium]|nr:MFS transporter [Hyphomonadaceae bacterium]
MTRRDAADGTMGDGLKPGRELLIYFTVVALYFFAFGLQMVIYPSLVTFVLNEDARRVGEAQMALSAPMFALLLFGGLLAERVRAGTGLFWLQLAFALPPLALAWAATTQAIAFQGVLIYGVVMGSLAAFMLPMRDAALNGVVGREIARGSQVALARAAAGATAVQLGAQIGGLMTGAMAGANPAPFLILQALSVVVAGVLSLQLRAPRPVVTARTVGAAFAEIRAGLAYAFRDPVMGPMLWTSAYIGVFIIGSFQVLFPLIVRDVYGGDAEQVGHLLAIFFGASFVSAVLVGALPPMRRPGRALLVSHMLAAAILASFAIEKPLWAFMASVGVWGLGAGVTMSSSRTITQSSADPAYLGRVLAVYSMGFMGGAPIGAFLIAQAVHYLGPSSASLAPAAGLALAAAALGIFSPIWKMERAG